MIRRIGKWLVRHRRRPWARRIDSALLAIHKGYENLNYNLHANGELNVLTRLSLTGDIKTVFDVGANRGDWTYVATKVFPAAHIHAFEIVPETFAHLRNRLGDVDNVTLNDVGLSDEESTTTVYYSPRLHAIATCVAGFSEAFHQYQPNALQVRTTSGDRYCASKGTSVIDFLKIDVEGFEPQVLRGFEGMLKSGKIDVIQFEYGYINIDTHFLLKDFHDYLSQFDMVIGKIYPDYVDFRGYRHADEDFYGPNYLAVRRDRKDLLRALGDSAST